MASIFVRAFEPEDVPLINKWRNDPEIQEMTGGIIRKVSSEMEKEWVHQKMMNNYSEVYWAICLNDQSKKMIGYTSLNNINYINRTSEGGGIVIGEKEYRDGFIIFETTLIKLDYVFNTLNINRHSGKCLEDHRVSSSFMMALNYHYEGCFREAVYKNGKYHNLLHYSILRHEYYRYLENGDYEMSKIIKRFRKLAQDKKNSK